MAILVTSVLLTGCATLGTQIDDMALCMSMGIDKDEQGITLTTEFLDLSGGQKGEQSQKYFLESVSDKTISDAIMKQKLMHPKEIVPMHNKVIVFGESMAKSGIMDLLSDFSRTNFVRGGTCIVAAKGRATELLKSTTLDERSLSQSIIKLVNRHGIEAKAVEFLAEKSGKPQDSMITVLDTSQSDGRDRLMVTGAELLKKGKLAGYLNVEEMNLIAMLKNEKPDVRIKVLYQNNPVEVILHHNNLKLYTHIANNKPEFRYGGKVSFNINKAKFGTISTVADNANVERLVARTLEQKLNALMNKVVKRYHCDVLGFGDHLYRYQTGYWKKNQKQWGKIFPEIDVSFDISVKTNNIGLHI